MSFEIQIRTTVFQEILRRSVQAKLYTACVPPQGPMTSIMRTSSRRLNSARTTVRSRSASQSTSSLSAATR
jgi:hypothetical protein